MIIYLITHGERNYGRDPRHKPEGLEQIRKISLPEKISLVLTGTGRRHYEIWSEIANVPQNTDKFLDNVPVKASPFCGSADALEQDGISVILAWGGKVPLKNYWGVGFPAFDAWAFVSALPDKALLCSGGELVKALGQKPEKGRLYKIDTGTKTVALLQ